MSDINADEAIVPCPEDIGAMDMAVNVEHFSHLQGQHVDSRRDYSVLGGVPLFAVWVALACASMWVLGLAKQGLEMIF